MRIVIANPRGFCAGVERAILIVERALAEWGAPVYARHEIVHNRHVVEDLRRRGVVFVDELDDIPAGGLVIFSAHGVAPAVVEAARVRGLRMLDATCPLVSKVQLEVARHGRAGRSVILIGHRDHPEIEGTTGFFRGRNGAEIHVVSNRTEAQTVTVPTPDRVAYATQTTLSVDDTSRIVAVLERRFPRLVAPARSDICYATQNRQTAARELAARADLVLVVGAPHSSNSARLRELAAQTGVPAYLIQDASELDPQWLSGRDVIGVTSGASVPEASVRDVIERLQAWWPGTQVETFGEPERVVFRLPRELRRRSSVANGATGPQAASPL